MPTMTSQAKRWLIVLFAVAACARPEPLTEQKAREIVFAEVFRREPVYAEVPQRVWFGPKSPKDDYDEKAVRTLRNLEREGLVTVEYTKEADGHEVYQARVTKEGFAILGTMPSARGPVFRARIAEKAIDDLRNFVRHPSEPTTGSAELVWHYEKPTRYYEMFETKINKPLNTPFVSLVSFYWDNGWKFNVTVRKTDAAEG
jgi:hypothetical protein